MGSELVECHGCLGLKCVEHAVRSCFPLRNPPAWVVRTRTQAARNLIVAILAWPQQFRCDRYHICRGPFRQPLREARSHDLRRQLRLPGGYCHPELRRR